MSDPASQPHAGQHQRTVNMDTETTRARTANVRLLITSRSPELRISSSKSARIDCLIEIFVKSGRYSDVDAHRSWISIVVTPGFSLTYMFIDAAER
jgi:hypothetical protein